MKNLLYIFMILCAGCSISSSIDSDFEADLAGVFSTLSTTFMDNNGNSYTIDSSQIFTITDDDLDFTISDSSGESLEFEFKAVIDSSSAVYWVNGSPIIVSISGDKLYANGTEIATIDTSTIGDYVTTSSSTATLSARSLFTLKEHEFVTIEADRNIEIVDINESTNLLEYVDSINSSNFIYSYNGASTTVTVDTNGDIYWEGSQILRKIQSSAFGLEAGTYFTTIDSEFTLTNSSHTVLPNKYLYLDANTNITIKSTESNLVFRFLKAVNSNEAIYEYDGGRNIFTISNNEVLITNVPLAYSNTNTSFTNSLQDTYYTLNRRGDIFYIDDSYDIPPLYDDTILKFETILSEEYALYKDDDNDVFIRFDGRILSRIDDNNDSRRFAVKYQYHLNRQFLESLPGGTMRIISPEIQSISVELPIIPFTFDSSGDIYLKDESGANVTLQFLYTDTNTQTAMYSISTTTNALSIINDEVFVDNQRIAVLESSLSDCERNFIGRYTDIDKIEDYGYGYLNDEDVLYLYIYHDDAYITMHQVINGESILFKYEINDMEYFIIFIYNPNDNTFHKFIYDEDDDELYYKLQPLSI